MKIKRQKRVNRYLTFFKNHFGFHEPYQVLLDGTFCQAALQAKMSVRDQVAKYMGGHVKMLTTCCAIVETEKLGHLLRGASLILKQFAVHKCGHEKQPLSAFWCFMDMLSDRNKHRYMIATQDDDMRLKLRRRVGIPLLYVHYRGPLLEKPSIANKKKANAVTESRFRPSDHQVSVLNQLKEEILGDGKDEQTMRRRRKRALGPNPLSCKKKKPKGKKSSHETIEEKTGKRRKRRRIRMADHVKEHLATADPSSSASGIRAPTGRK